MATFHLITSKYILWSVECIHRKKVDYPQLKDIV